MKTLQTFQSIKEVIDGKKELKQYLSTGNEYYQKEAEYTEKVRNYLNRIFRDEQMKELSKEELIDLISICSTHRPCALHSLLITFSKTSQFY